MRDAISLLDQLASTGGKITLELAQTVLGTATSQSVIGLVQAVIDTNPAPASTKSIARSMAAQMPAPWPARWSITCATCMLIQMGNGDQVEVTADTRAQMTAARQSSAHRRSAAHDARLQRCRHRYARRLVAFARASNWLLPKCWSCRAQVEVVSAPRQPSKPRSFRRPLTESSRIQPPVRPEFPLHRPRRGNKRNQGSQDVHVTLEQVTKAWRQISASSKPKTPMSPRCSIPAKCSKSAMAF